MADELKSVIADLRLAQKRAQKAKYLEAKAEVADNVYPCMIALAEALDERLAEQDEVIADILEDEGSVIQPELAAQLFATLELTKEFIGKVRELKLDDLRKKEIARLAEVLEKSMVMVEPEISAAAVDPDDGEEEGDEPAAPEDKQPEEPGEGEEEEDEEPEVEEVDPDQAAG